MSVSKKQAADRQRKRKRNTGSSTWRKMAKYYLARDIWCAKCSRNGVKTIATVVDHIDGDTYNEHDSNFQCLCKRCHDRKTYMENR